MSAFDVPPPLADKKDVPESYFDTSEEAIANDPLRFRYRCILDCFPAVAAAVKDKTLNHKRLFQSTGTEDSNLTGKKNTPSFILIILGVAIYNKGNEGKKECKRYLGYWLEYMNDDGVTFPTAAHMSLGQNHDSIAFLVWCRIFHESKKAKGGVAGVQVGKHPLTHMLITHRRGLESRESRYGNKDRHRRRERICGDSNQGKKGRAAIRSTAVG